MKVGITKPKMMGLDTPRTQVKRCGGTEGDDEGISGYGDARITNQNDYAQDYDNVPEWQD